MNRARLQIIVAFFLTVSIIVTYKVVTMAPTDPELKEAQVALETEKLKLKRANLQRYSDLNFYGIAGILGACAAAIVIVAAGFSRAKIRQASVHTARIGQHSEIPVHHRDLRNFYPIAVNLSLAEIEASVSHSHERAYQISRQMIEDVTLFTRALAGQRGLLPIGDGKLNLEQTGALPQTPTPTFADLLHTGMLASGKPLVFGFDRQGQPQYRSLQDLKSLAIAGWQGSGKTLSTAYIVASSVLAYGVHAYVIDPHKNHDEGLYALLRPLEKTGHVTIINPFDTPALLKDLNRLLDQRLNGELPGSPGILLVIDEMARLAKMECFDILVKFLERCTEEIRKANITFIGGSHKWTARHFKGRADIRGCMNSMLIHKTKPSQADLLLEDAQDKNLVKHIYRPGDAILVTDYAEPSVVSMPFCRQEDVATVADMLTAAGEIAEPDVLQVVGTSSVSPSRRSTTVPAPPPKNPRSPRSSQEADTANSSTLSKPKPRKTSTSSSTASKNRKKLISFELHRKKQHVARQTGFDPMQLTANMVKQQIEKLKQQGSELTQAKIASRAGMSQSLLSRTLNEQRPFKPEEKMKLYEILFLNECRDPAEARG